MTALRCMGCEGDLALYRVEEQDHVYLASTKESRAICNDPLIYGVEYTSKLSAVCAHVLRQLPLPIRESETSVVHLLRGGLNFGLREALYSALGWNDHGSSFLSAQRRRKPQDPEQWEIGESGYRKFTVGNTVSLVLGDVVASGASLEHGLNVMLDRIAQGGCRLRSIVFFTIGGSRTEEVFRALDERLEQEHPDYAGSHIVYLEGRFPVPDLDTPLRIKITGTDLLRQGSCLAPEFVESQYDSPMFPVERCTIYDAGSRAFEPKAYLEDVREYWELVADLGEVSFAEYLHERCPGLDASRFGRVELSEIAARRVETLNSALNAWGPVDVRHSEKDSG